MVVSPKGVVSRTGMMRNDRRNGSVCCLQWNTCVDGGFAVETTIVGERKRQCDATGFSRRCDMIGMVLNFVTIQKQRVWRNGGIF